MLSETQKQISESMELLSAMAKLNIDIEGLIEAPPADNSGKTARELLVVKRAANNRTEEETRTIKSIDKDPNFFIKKTLKKHGIEFPEQQFAKAYNLLKPIIVKLKRRFRRSRPYALDKQINYISSNTAKTMSYPSGHTAYAALAYEILSDMYPEHSNELKSGVNKAGEARVIMGVHYPSDNEASKLLLKKLWPKIKKEIE